MMLKYVVLSSCLFGSVYICSKSLHLMNQAYLENKKIPNKLMIINGLTFIFSGSVFIYGIHHTIKDMMRKPV